ncbi:hypothetical protein SAMN02745883_01257 [Caminicella sporogenes DSM 14501]|uniref:Uncharacterized protein n=1 Tax=Caminicella sporogenes DSM 14501 TaxID=1121266 RepID=A0A1M6PPS4_9FIRM|nr:hypothetical protein [Caminicella sporogenes]RKD22024.1 hypothetical protein BET04_07170 [Caminicella sporogenes]SHK09966.1 hypothetical protein SAMN02745883_01257 [Caminicella sporogenes DSM 14501]
MQLLDLIENKYKVISVVGMAKNAGKTVTLNELIMEAVDRNIRLGITSIGRDGEKQDMVTYTEKPMIFVNKGTIIATAEETFKLSEAKLEVLETTDVRTSIGNVIIGKTLTDGHVQIAGPAINEDTKLISQKMISFGAELVIVDGAIDRLSSASPAVTEATILATGAVLSRDMDKVIEKSAHQVNLFNLDVVEDEQIRAIAEEYIKRVAVSIINDKYEVTTLDIKTALNCGSKIAGVLKEDSKYVVIKGSLVAKTLMDIVSRTKKYKNVTFIVKDSTKIFIDYNDWRYFERINVKVAVLEKINILAVTINPYSPGGYYFSQSDFLNKMRKILSPIPVIDVMISGGI